MAMELFECAAERLERGTGLDRLEARGTLRLALKSAGLEPGSLTPEQLRVVFERILPGELQTRGVSGAAEICETLMEEIAASPAADAGFAGASADDVFRRLGRD
jgi:hypothetical protein